MKEIYIDLDGQELIKITYSSGNIYYENKQGKFNRSDGPAVIQTDGTLEYWLEGKEVSKKEIDLIWLRKQVDE